MSDIGAHWPRPESLREVAFVTRSLATIADGRVRRASTRSEPDGRIRGHRRHREKTSCGNMHHSTLDRPLPPAEFTYLADGGPVVRIS
jgi:hypothetical protein